MSGVRANPETMTDTEVETTLREIRERVRAEVGAATRGATVPARDAVDAGDAGDANGAQTDSLARLDVNLATAERAWSRLPPLVSNRRGWPARLELWVKRKIKRAAHWFTWEQVNFNSAVYHALRDTRAALEDSQRRLEASQQQLEASRRQLADVQAALEAAVRAESQARARSAAEIEARVAASVASSEARVTSAVASAVASSEANVAAAEARGAEELRSLAAALESRLDSGDARLSEAVATLRQESAASHEGLRGELSAELRERVEHVLEEQRVSIRQLALEAGERAVMHERARRRVEQRLEEISKAVISDK
jgi:hypothetical protein